MAEGRLGSTHSIDGVVMADAEHAPRGLRVLHLIDSGGLYGAERMLLALVAEQIRQGLAPMILSAGEPGIDVKPLETEARRLALPVTVWRMRPGLNLREAWRIAVWARSGRYQVLHAHGYKFNILLALLPQRVRGRDSVFVTTLHGYLRAPFATRLWVYEQLDRLALRRAQAVVIVAESMRPLLPRIQGRNGRRLVFIPNGIDPAPPEPLPLPPEIAAFTRRYRTNMVVVGRLSREKGLTDLLEAVAGARAELEDVGFTLIGDGPLRTALEAHIAAEGLQERFLLPGYLDGVAAHLGHFDALLLPSWTEGLPITVLEALRAGCPVIATRVGELPSVLGDCPGAALVPPHRPAELAAAIVRQANTAPGAAPSIASEERFRSEYTASTMAARYLSLYAATRG